MFTVGKGVGLGCETVWMSNTKNVKFLCFNCRKRRWKRRWKWCREWSRKWSRKRCWKRLDKKRTSFIKTKRTIISYSWKWSRKWLIKQTRTSIIKTTNKTKQTSITVGAFVAGVGAIVGGGQTVRNCDCAVGDCQMTMPAPSVYST